MTLITLKIMLIYYIKDFLFIILNIMPINYISDYDIDYTKAYAYLLH